VSGRSAKWQSSSDLRASLIFAGLMLAIALAARLAPWFGLTVAPDFKQRALMVIVAAFIVSIGNDIPKRLTSLTCRDADAGRIQSFQRFAGWTWVLAGLAVCLGWFVLPRPAASALTLIVLPLAMALTVGGVFGVRASRRGTP
jgi:hypothetical protein